MIQPDAHKEHKSQHDYVNRDRRLPADEQRDRTQNDSSAGAAWYERYQRTGYCPLAHRCKDSRTYDCGHIASGASHKRDDSASVKPELVHQPVCQERHRVQVSRILKKSQHEIECKHIRDSHSKSCQYSSIKTPYQSFADMS